MKFVGDTISERGVTERRFDLEVESRLVPGIVWTPAEGDARALVLIGHGGGLHKRIGYVLSLARRFVRHHGIACVAIDGPQHGDRAAGAGGGDGAAAWWSASTTDDTVADWRATLAAARDLPEVGRVATGYWGFSMGTIFGLPFVAAEPEIDAAVFGVMGLSGPTRERLTRDARQITLPVLFMFQWHDELFSRQDGLALFDALGSADKQMHIHPGPHSGTPLEGFEATEAFLANRLLAPR